MPTQDPFDLIPVARSSPAGLPPAPSPAGRSVAWLLLLGMVGLLLIGMISWTNRTQLLFGPTPTSTATGIKVVVVTADFRATRNAQELATQEAYNLASLGVDTTPPAPTIAPSFPDSDETPPATAAAAETATPTDAVPPDNGGEPQAATPQPSPTLPPPAITPETETPNPTPIPATATVATPSPTETATSLPTPTVTASYTPFSTPTVTTVPAVAVASLNGVVGPQPAPLYLGPGIFFPTRESSLAAGQRIQAQGRDAYGEWVFVCCANGQPGWVRQAAIQLQENSLPADFPADATPDDVRWLAQRPPDDQSTPTPTYTPIPAGDYPLVRRDRANRAQVDPLGAPDFRFPWTDSATTGGAMESHVTVAGANVLVGSADLHLYSFENSTGNQRWRQQFTSQLPWGASVHDNRIFVADQNGQITALEDQVNRATVLWRTQLPSSPSSPINVAGRTLFISTIAATDHRLFALDSHNGALLWNYPTSGNYLHYPTIGHQLIYAGDEKLWALDIYSGTLVWEKADIAGVAAAPIYDWPGLTALAELFVADEFNGVYGLDANTGRQLWRSAGPGQVTGMALDESALYVSGSDFLLALNRRNGQPIWELPLQSEVLGGPIVGNGRVLVVLRSGQARMIDARGGGALGIAYLPTSAVGAAAVSNGWIFIPGADQILYALQTSLPTQSN